MTHQEQIRIEDEQANEVTRLEQELEFWHETALEAREELTRAKLELERYRKERGR